MCAKWGNWAVLAALAVVLAAPALYAWSRPTGEGAPCFSPRRNGETLVIDAGHGGEDGGAVSADGLVESGVNLAIARRLDLLLGLYGEAPVLLREEDVSLHDPSATTLREKKRSDLQNRVARVEEVEGATLLSIHQNSYPDPRYHGAQVFYAGEISLPLAEYTQELLRSHLDPENTRAAKLIPDTVYLMNHISCPAILVECGFLSNPEEAGRLATSGYQTRIAAVLAAAWLTGGAGNPKENPSL